MLHAKRQHGFTLMEVLVSLAVFSTVTVAVTDIFLLSSRAERRVSGEEQLAGEARVALEYLARLVRTGSIAYDLMPPVTVPQESIALRSAAGTPYVFSRSADAQVCGAVDVSCLVVDEAGTAASLTSRSADVLDLKFFIAPASDPFVFDPATGSYPVDRQPRVTIVLAMALTANPAKKLVVQTTVTTRQYAR